MKKYLLLALSLAFVSCSTGAKYFETSKSELLDKIKGGWAGQTIGVTFGAPTEFRYRGSVIPDSIALEWNKDQVRRFFNNDDIYMDLTFVETLDRVGLDAPADSFATAFANAGYMLWHANQSARYNILHGIMPPASGHWKNNPHANDIDFQIESDFAGLMAPGMPVSIVDITDKVGHLMNYGDGWYGGVFVSSMYTQAFLTDDIPTIISQALKMIPEESHFHQCMSDVIKWHKENPDDWKATWQLCQDKWTGEPGCPDGVFGDFNIDALVNSAYILIGLLYGEGDFGKTLEISTRCGQDSDCNPSSAAGILGTLLGYDTIPEEYLSCLRPVEGETLSYTSYSLNDVYQVSLKHALEMISRGGGKVKGDKIFIRKETPSPVRLEISFEGLKPKVFTGPKKTSGDTFEYNFEGCGVVVKGGFNKAPADYTALLDVTVDGKFEKTVPLPASSLKRSNDLYWNFDLEAGPHTIVFQLKNPSKDVRFVFRGALVYEKDE